MMSILIRGPQNFVSNRAPKISGRALPGDQDDRRICRPGSSPICCCLLLDLLLPASVPTPDCTDCRYGLLCLLSFSIFAFFYWYVITMCKHE